jgi:hypothetical protein
MGRRNKIIGVCLYCHEYVYSNEDYDYYEIPFFMSRRSRIVVHKKCRGQVK